ncbi:ATP-binding cassette domain-containing protein, partial [Xenorhabdus sp. ZM]|nr:ATP-binding cassette domain-containing protein [Xenorhabdus sp. ZM]
VFELLDEKYDIVNVPNAVQTKKLNGEIVFDNVSFRYNADEKEMLHNLSLTMQPGEKVALVGASGGGKSSLASLIPRFYDVSEGAVYVDGIDVRKYNMR